jgi:electron transfer flavoprotein beta subunit
MKIAVLIKQVPDTGQPREIDASSGLMVRSGVDMIVDESSERATEIALRFKDADASTEVVAITMGPEQAEEALRHVLAMGADRALQIVDDGLVGSDLNVTAVALAAAIGPEQFDLVVAGEESTDGQAGVIPAMVAELLGIADLSSLESVNVRDHQVHGVRRSDGFLMSLHCELPAVVSVCERSAEPRYPHFRAVMAAKRKPLQTLTAEQLGVDTDPATRSQVLSVKLRPPRQSGKKVVDDGTAVTQLVGFLSKSHLI